ncbi:MAG: TonB C-terminal domain-containing protein [Proteobacteria bacterium]|nr:TonB C-terminal domain-containing protein [Pseudomonadota bacterium]
MTSSGRMKRRGDGGIGLNSMVILSFLLHALLLSIIFLSPSMPARKWTFGPVYSVNLVSLPAYLVEKKSVPSISEEIIGIGPRNNSVVLRKDVKKISSLPIKRITTRKRNVGKVGRAVEDVRRRVMSSAAVSPATSEMTMKMRVYYSVIWSRIKGEWALPGGILPDENIEAVIGARILRSGAAVDLSFEKRSGNKYFDESAMRAIKKASPFPPLPEWIRGKSMEVGIRFHSSELR